MKIAILEIDPRERQAFKGRKGSRSVAEIVSATTWLRLSVAPAGATLSPKAWTDATSVVAL